METTEKWISQVRLKADPQELGMILVHTGIVRGSSKSGKPVRGMKLSFDERKLDARIPVFKQRPGILAIKVWINSGNLKVGDDIMRLLVAGRFRTDVLPVFEEILSLIKNEIVREEEIE
jgi:molybdopterin synthase catalytic subunit